MNLQPVELELEGNLEACRPLLQRSCPSATFYTLHGRHFMQGHGHTPDGGTLSRVIDRMVDAVEAAGMRVVRRPDFPADSSYRPVGVGWAQFPEIQRLLAQRVR